MLERIYLNSPRPIQDLALSIIGARNRIVQRGSWFREHATFLSRSERWGESQLTEWQDRQLAGLLNHALATVPHFQALGLGGNHTHFTARDVLSELPFTNKEALKHDPRAFTSIVIRPREMVRVTTSGTTGSPTTFFIDRRSRQEHFAYFDRFLRWANLDSTAWHAVFMGRLLGKDSQLKHTPWRTDFSNRRVYYSSYHITRNSVEKYLRHMTSRSLEWVEGYPSAIGNLAQLGLSAGANFPKIRAVIPSSETLDDITRSTIEKAFGKVIWEFYAAAEQAAFISQCEAGSLHINPEYGIVEFQSCGYTDNGEELHEMIGTSFRNRAMPLLRYRTGDLVVRDHTACACGRTFPRLKRIVGRTVDAVVLPDGRRLTAIGDIIRGLPIERSQVVQISEGAVEFRVVPIRSGWSVEAKNTLEHRLRDRLGDSARIRIQVVRSIPPGPNGKTPLVRALRPSTKGDGAA